LRPARSKKIALSEHRENSGRGNEEMRCNIKKSKISNAGLVIEAWKEFPGVTVLETTVQPSKR
jgi:hypothetical protein